MANIKIRIPLVDGSEYVYSPEYASGKDFINSVVTDDWGPPPRHMIIESTTSDGRPLRIVIPYSTTEGISVIVDEAPATE